MQAIKKLRENSQFFYLLSATGYRLTADLVGAPFGNMGAPL